MDVIARMVAFMADHGEPTEYEALYWQIEGPFVDGWVAAIVWDHHDGVVEWARQHGATLEAAVEAAIAQYQHSPAR